MTDGAMFDILREALYTALIVATPMLGSALIMGVAVGVMQALTSIQEMTLTFVPKIAAMALILWIAMDVMGRSIIDLYRDKIIPLVAGG